MNCTWVEIDAPDANGRRRVRCSVCGFTTLPTGSPLDRIFLECGGPTQFPDEAAGIAQKVGAFTLAVQKWIAAGRPFRDEQQIAAIFEVCAGCPKFRPNKGSEDRGYCRACGCRVRRQGGLLNKIKMLTENCPLGKW